MQKNCTAGSIIFFILFLLNVDIVTANEKANKTIQYRLPNNTKPIFYDIKLFPHMSLDNMTFEGETKIDIEILNKTSDITLHAHHSIKIKNDDINLEMFQPNPVHPKNHIRDNTTDFLILQFDESINPGLYKLYIKYTGTINNDTVGIYKKLYINDKNEKTPFIATRLSPIKARRAFPCWDEPAMKATFRLSIRHLSNYTAASNMPVNGKSDDHDGYMWTDFATTPIMSTYLIAFVVSDFQCLSNAKKSFNICTPKKSLPDAKYILNIGEKVLPHMIEYTGLNISSVISKLDNYILPEAPFGGMENWGIIIYRDINVIVNGNTSCSTKQTAIELIIHELSHQWFGNLVTPAWWKYIWLKEGMAHYFQFYFADKILPEWDMMNTFVARTLQLSAISMDATNHYNYLNWNPETPTEIKSQFTTMAYHKGASIIYMLSQILSEDVFQQGIRKYIKDHQFDIATSDDLWKAMQTAHDETKSPVNISVKDVMDPWIEQKGYPIVHVVRNYENETTILNQTSNLSSEPTNKWCIPINYATKSKPSCSCTAPSHWLMPNDAHLIIGSINKDDWLLVNLKQSGYYRVDYDADNWLKIAKFLNDDNYEIIHVLNRGQVINDLFFMAFNNRQNLTTFFELTKYLSREIEYIPWKHVSNVFKSIKRKIVGEELQNNIKNFFHNLMNKVIDHVGFDEKTDDSLIMKKKRSLILQLACDLGHAKCRNVAASKLLNYLENPKENPISPNLEYWVLCSGANDTKNELLLQEKIDNGESKYLRYLSCAENKAYLQKYVDKVLTNNSTAKNNDLRMIMGYMMGEGNKDNWDYAVDYFIEKFDRITEYFNSTTLYSSILNDYIWRTPTVDRMTKISKFVDQNNERLSPWINSAISQQTQKLEWSKIHAPILNTWLHHQLSATPSPVP